MGFGPRPTLLPTSSCARTQFLLTPSTLFLCVPIRWLCPSGQLNFPLIHQVPATDKTLLAPRCLDQDPVRINPNHFKIIFINYYIRHVLHPLS